MPTDVREELTTRDLERELGTLVRASRQNRPMDWTPLLEKLVKLAREYPASAAPRDIVESARYSFSADHTPEQAATAWRAFADTPNTKLAALAREKLRVFDLIQAPLDLAFTALDGRQVDLKTFRGKVVLIDFWAMWCGPCIKELPNVKRVYEAYRDRGLEVIGISLDFAKDRQKLLDFEAKENMPWPQHFEGKKLNAGGNTLAARFSITGIPATLLLDKNGRVVSTHVRGEALESEVKKLLKE